jgi:hypothetical protein
VNTINKWDYAPPEATHHTVDADGRGFWYAREPRFSEDHGRWYGGVLCLDHEYWKAAAPHSLEARPVQQTNDNRMKLGDEPRDVVVWFACLMEANLRKNDYKGGWDDCSLLWLFAKLGEELGELGEALVDNHFPEGREEMTITRVAAQWIEGEATDIANLAMMIADKAHKLTAMKLHTSRPDPLEPVAVTNKIDRNTPEDE